MKIRLALLAALPLFAACADWTDQVAGPSANMPSQLQSSLGPQDMVDRYIVVFRDDVQNPSAAADQLIQNFGGTVHFKYEHAIKGFAATLPAQSLDGIRRSPLVSYVAPDGIVTTMETDNSVSSWGLDRIDQRDLPLSNSYTWTNNGSGVQVYILDTGIQTTHTQFGGRASVGADFILDGQNGNDCHGHGTHVAGTVGGSEYGVARGTNLVAVRVLNCAGSGSFSQVIAGINWVTANRVPPAVANMSLGGGLYPPLNDAVTGAIASGVTFAVAAGNSNADACNYSPAATPNALTVGSTTISDARSSFSNWGTCVDVFAPGSSITSAWIGATNTATNTISGTSMASPHVAGVAALFLSANTSATPSQVGTAITNGATSGKVVNPGTGSPNLLLYSLITGGGGGNSPPTASFTNSCTNLACTFDGTLSSDDGSIATYAWNFGDNTTDVGVTTSHIYAAGGNYTVVLTVTDNLGATGSTSKLITVIPPPGVITLSVTAYKVKGLQKADLSWSGASGNVDIVRDGVVIFANTANDGVQTDNINNRGAGSYTYRVCLTGTQTCSSDFTITF